MNRRLVSPLLLASLLATVAFAASAQTATSSAGVDVDASAQATTDANADARFEANATPQIDRNCLRQTGSRIVANANANATRSASDRSDKRGQRCVAANGRVYSREDIDRTGEVDIADALRKLDPAIH